MSSPGFASTLDLRLAPSHRALKLLYGLHLAALAIVPFAMQPGLPMALVAAGFAVSWFCLRRHPVFGFGPRALTRLLWQPGRGWQLGDARGHEQPAQLLGDSYVTPRLIVLNFRGADGRRRTRALLGDELSEDALRRLRARLLSGPLRSGDEAAAQGDSRP